MNPGDRPTAAPNTSTPPPADTAEFVLEPTTPVEVDRAARPTAAEVLGWVAGSRGPWFPSAHARATGIPREALDEPLNELRAAGLVAVAEWVRGLGQGYAITPEGLAARGGPAAAGGPPPAVTPALPEPVGVDPRPPVVTPALLLANVLWFFAGLVMAVRAGAGGWAYLTGRDPAALGRLGAVTGLDLLAGDWWRLGTNCFVHVGLLHLALNVVAIGMMGPLAELLWGRWRLAAIYALSGLAGGCLAMALHPTQESGNPVLLAGASGAIWGVMTSLAAWLLLFRAELSPALATDWGRRMARILVLNVGISFVPGVSWEAHLGGGAAGFVAAGLLNALRFGDRWRRAAAAALLGLLPAGCVGGLMWAMRDGDAWAPLRNRAAAAEAARLAQAEVDRVRAAVEEHNREAAPLLDAIRPDKVHPAETRGRNLLMFGRGRSPAAAESRAEVAGLRDTAAELVGKLADPTGVAPLDQLRDKARAYADARRRALDRLLGLLAAGAVPDAAAVKALKDAQAEADRAWPGAGRP
ncbi:MAG: rhomboid family intramembrane serine protease [Gemmataceae bacterium]|nr:rhomboid family intramembrane serine protease [Gemmataceae bacterium]